MRVRDLSIRGKSGSLLKAMTMESRQFGQKVRKLFWGVTCWKIPGNVDMGKKWLKYLFFGSFFSHAVQQVSLSIFHQAIINTAHQTRLTFDLEIETTHGHPSSFQTRPHECRWQRWRVHLDRCPRAWEVACVVLWSSVTFSQNSVFRPSGDDREFLSQFSTHQPPNVFWTEACSAPATNYRPQSERCTPNGGRSP